MTRSFGRRKAEILLHPSRLPATAISRRRARRRKRTSWMSSHGAARLSSSASISPRAAWPSCLAVCRFADPQLGRQGRKQAQNGRDRCRKRLFRRQQAGRAECFCRCTGLFGVQAAAEHNAGSVLFAGYAADGDRETRRPAVLRADGWEIKRNTSSCG